jgi:hypothetical protein
MYIDHHGTEEYPFYATFYHLGVDESKPLDEQVEEKIVSFESKCDISDQDTGLNNDKLTLFFPFDATDGNTLGIKLGESVEVESYGLVQRGRVLGVFPSQLGGMKVMCSRI